MDFGTSKRIYRKNPSFHETAAHYDTRFLSVDSQNPYRVSYRIPESQKCLIPGYDAKEGLMYYGANAQQMRSPLNLTGVCNRESYRKGGHQDPTYTCEKDFSNTRNDMPDLSSTTDDLRQNYVDQELTTEASDTLYRNNQQPFQKSDPRKDSVHTQNIYKQNNFKKKSTFIRNKDLGSTNCKINRSPMEMGRQRKQYAEKTTYCRPVLNLYNQEYIYKYSQEKSNKLQSLVKKLAEAREREKQREAWNNYINELKHKHGYMPKKTRVPYIPNKPPVAHFIEDCYNTRYAPSNSNHTRYLLNDIYGAHSSKQLKQKCLITRGTNPENPNLSLPQVTLLNEYTGLYGNKAMCYPSASRVGYPQVRPQVRPHNCLTEYNPTGYYHGNSYGRTIIAETKYPRPKSAKPKNFFKAPSAPNATAKLCNCDCKLKGKSGMSFSSRKNCRDWAKPSKAKKVLPEETSEKKTDEIDDNDGGSSVEKNNEDEEIRNKESENDEGIKGDISDDSNKQATDDNKEKKLDDTIKNNIDNDDNIRPDKPTKDQPNKLLKDQPKKPNIFTCCKRKMSSDEEMKKFNIKEEIVKISDNVEKLKDNYIKEEIVKISDNVAKLKEKNDISRNDSSQNIFRSIESKLDQLVRAINALVVEMNSKPPPVTKCTLTECIAKTDKSLVADPSENNSPSANSMDSRIKNWNCCRQFFQNQSYATQDSKNQTNIPCTLPNCTKTKCVAKIHNTETKSTGNQNSEVPSKVSTGNQNSDDGSKRSTGNQNSGTKTNRGSQDNIRSPNTNYGSRSSHSDEVVCAIMSRARPCLPFSEIFRERNNTSKLDKILLEEIGKSDQAKRDIAEILGNPCMKISIELPTKERSTEVTASFSKSLFNPAITQTVFAKDQQITIAVNTDPLSLLALIKVSTESIRQLLSHIAMLQFAPIQPPVVAHRKREATFICNICGDVFYDPTQLSQHIKEHNLGTTRDCCICRHLLDMRKQRSVGVFSCRYCGECFTRAYCCELHQQTCARRLGRVHDVQESLTLLS